jgi:transglutaminase-like putative cysteine protease
LLSESLHEADQLSGPADRDELRGVVAAAHAWVETYTDCQGLEWFSFDRNSDHVRDAS